MVRAFGKLLPGFLRVIGHGRDCLILEDHWVLDLPLCWKPTFINMQYDLSSVTVSELFSQGSFYMKGASSGAPVKKKRSVASPHSIMA